MREPFAKFIESKLGLEGSLLTDSSIPDNEITTNQIEASNSSASATITITMTGIPDE